MVIFSLHEAKNVSCLNKVQSAPSNDLSVESEIGKEILTLIEMESSFDFNRYQRLCKKLGTTSFFERSYYSGFPFIFSLTISPHSSSFLIYVVNESVSSYLKTFSLFFSDGDRTEMIHLSLKPNEIISAGIPLKISLIQKKVKSATENEDVASLTETGRKFYDSSLSSFYYIGLEIVAENISNTPCDLLIENEDKTLLYFSVIVIVDIVVVSSFFLSFSFLFFY